MAVTVASCGMEVSLGSRARSVRYFLVANMLQPGQLIQRQKKLLHVEASA
jgi:hypothetical protein